MSLTDRINQNARRIPAWPIYIAGVLPVIWLFYAAVTGGLGVEPIKALEHELGEIGLQLIVLGLCITPLRRFAGINLIKYRRAIGLLAFLYVLMHFLVWLVLDMGLLWQQALTDIYKRPYITMGMAGLLLLLPLAITSNNWSVRRLGPAAWRRLHQLTYFAALAGAVHYVWLVKAWPVEPFVYLGVILALLALRITKRRPAAA